MEVLHDGVWGTVCDDYWGDSDARVVCRQLGLGGGTARGSAYRGEGSGEIWMDDVSCSGSEQQLEGCSFGGWGSHNCVHSEDASVCCGGEALSMSVSGVVVSYGATEYRTLDAWAPEDSGDWTCQDQYIALPEGWQIAANNPGSIAVTAAYPW